MNYENKRANLRLPVLITGWDTKFTAKEERMIGEPRGRLESREDADQAGPQVSSDKIVVFTAPPSDPGKQLWLCLK